MQGDEGLMGSGEFSRRSLLSPKALRVYEQRGLLVPATVDPANGYRRYAATQLEDARLVVRLRRLGMPLDRVAAVLAAPAAARAELLAAYWDETERRVAGQRALVAALLAQWEDPSAGGGAVHDVQQREVPQQRVLSEQRTITQPEMPAWVPAAVARLEERAAAYGGPSGPMLLVFHGLVTEDSDGPLEVCLPVAAPEDDPAVRVEPAHREAYVRLRKRETVFPSILTAYDEVAAWLQGQGLRPSAGPREVYFAHFPSAAPDDEVCDVAFPY
ncbi:DNA-binding transcriptional MerR regulator [Motilibacter rhizosphaerae]|uniref:DNA-binding transcriptional MerR regulator n=1 Tax=Motilibacter rhizosphaerae TaxID=598652 RepID=A0A4Q7NAG1_9ACTN|nr:MerR family transcriptional regulator [Motilibacter rhizosphaerae]RZS79470.1 DNA-binding transcriptional MerR regulator [Motilibacter rhizosphaerae]